MKSKLGAILFVVILLVATFGLISFASEFFFGKPINKVIEDLLFMFYRR